MVHGEVQGVPHGCLNLLFLVGQVTHEIIHTADVDYFSDAILNNLRFQTFKVTVNYIADDVPVELQARGQGQLRGGEVGPRVP